VIAILGTAFLSILVYFLLIRSRRRREDKIFERNQKRMVVSYPTPIETRAVNKDMAGITVPQKSLARSSVFEYAVALPGGGYRRDLTKTKGIVKRKAEQVMQKMTSPARAEEKRDVGDEEMGRKSTSTTRSTRKTMLIYDQEYPDRPPIVGVVEVPMPDLPNERELELERKRELQKENEEQWEMKGKKELETQEQSEWVTREGSVDVERELFLLEEELDEGWVDSMSMIRGSLDEMGRPTDYNAIAEQQRNMGIGGAI
jgi:hypothetical protein